MIDYTAILSRKYSAEWTLNGDDYEGLTWLSDTPKPSKQELDSLWDEVQSEIEQEKLAKIEQRNAVLAKLDLTEAEANLLLS